MTIKLTLSWRFLTILSEQKALVSTFALKDVSSYQNSRMTINSHGMVTHPTAATDLAINRDRRIEMEEATGAVDSLQEVASIAIRETSTKEVAIDNGATKKALDGEFTNFSNHNWN